MITSGFITFSCRGQVFGEHYPRNKLLLHTVIDGVHEVMLHKECKVVIWQKIEVLARQFEHGQI